MKCRVEASMCKDMKANNMGLLLGLMKVFNFAKENVMEHEGLIKYDKMISVIFGKYL